MKSGAVFIFGAAVLLGGWAQPSLGQDAPGFKANVNLAIRSIGPENDLYDYISRELANISDVKIVDENENYVINILVVAIDRDEKNDNKFAIHYATYSPYNSEFPEILVNSML